MGVSTEYLFLFDFDNTLMPTDYIAKSNIDMINPDIDNAAYDFMTIFLTEYENILFEFLNTLTNEYDVRIVTLGSGNWVNHATNLFMPKLRKYIDEKKIKVYENTEKKPNKEEVFNQIIKENMNKKQIILCSDAYQDFLDYFKVCNKLLKDTNISFKFFKFIEKPEVTCMINQYRCLKYIFPAILKSKDNLYIDLSRETFKAYSYKVKEIEKII